jgi:hypothetical protein
VGPSSSRRIRTFPEATSGDRPFHPSCHTSAVGTVTGAGQPCEHCARSRQLRGRVASWCRSDRATTLQDCCLQAHARAPTGCRAFAWVAHSQTCWYKTVSTVTRTNAVANVTAGILLAHTAPAVRDMVHDAGNRTDSRAFADALSYWANVPVPQKPAASCCHAEPNRSRPGQRSPVPRHGARARVAASRTAAGGGLRAAGGGRGRYGAPGEAEHDHALWFDSPAKDFTEALLVGNGRLGAVVSFREWDDVMALSEDTVWGGRPNPPESCDNNMRPVSRCAPRPAGAPRFWRRARPRTHGVWGARRVGRRRRRRPRTATAQGRRRCGGTGHTTAFSSRGRRRRDS